MNKTLIILVGGPCSGKSSIGKLVANHLNIPYISSGEIAREMAKNNNDIQNDLNSGKLAPESRMRKSIDDALWYYFHEMDCNIVILDGFPRFGEQAEWLLSDTHVIIDIRYVLIHASHWELRNRAENRGRNDDKSIEQRLDYYCKVTYKELFKYIDTTIDTEMANIENCATALEDYIKEVTGC